MPARRNEEGDRELQDDKVLDPDLRPVDAITDSEDDDGFDTPVRKEKLKAVRDTKTGRFVAGDGDEDDTRLDVNGDAGDEEFAYNIDDEDDEFNGSRRRRRNRARREKQARDQMVIGHLQHEIGQLRGLVGEMGRGQVSLVASEIDNQIRTEEGYLNQIDQFIAKALQDQDYVGFQKGQNLRDEARERIQGLRFHKRRVDQQLQDGGQQGSYQQQQRPNANGQQQGDTQNQNQPDPRAVRLSEMFMERFPWFDPSDQTDDDSREVVFLESELARKGSNPTSPKHWQRLEKMVRERNLGDDYQEDDVTDDYEDAKPRRTTRPGTGRSSGGRPGGASDFKLTADMKKALDDEGLLGDGLTEAQLKQRERLVKSWKSGIAKARKEGKL